MFFTLTVPEAISYISDFLNDFGVLDGLLILFFIFGHLAIYKLYIKNIKSKQEEINRIALENREYREIFINLIEQRLNIKNESQ